ncbi:hypothetical protein NL676_004397 [Syzygium grande]|nr:hypothetical protein NL676_004397 [Syzygium grande]
MLLPCRSPFHDPVAAEGGARPCRSLPALAATWSVVSPSVARLGGKPLVTDKPRGRLGGRPSAAFLSTRHDAGWRVLPEGALRVRTKRTLPSPECISRELRQTRRWQPSLAAAGSSRFTRTFVSSARKCDLFADSSAFNPTLVSDFHHPRWSSCNVDDKVYKLTAS